MRPAHRYRTIVVLLGVSLALVAACGKSSSTSAPPPSGAAPPPAADRATGSAGSAAPAAPPSAPIDDHALDAAIATQGWKPAAVRQRKLGARSAWAVVEAPRTAHNEVVELELLRVRSDGAAVLSLAPPAHGGTTTWNEDVAPFEVRDLDGDGREECVLVLEWQTTVPGTLIGEGAKQLYVIAGDGAPRVAFTAIVDYSTLAQQETDHDRTDPPPPEHIAYDWKIDGKPPVVSLQRTASELNKKRHPGLTRPGIDPLLSTGERADVPLPLH
jgi:hypothetical protein